MKIEDYMSNPKGLKLTEDRALANVYRRYLARSCYQKITVCYYLFRILQMTSPHQVRVGTVVWGSEVAVWSSTLVPTPAEGYKSRV